MPFARPSARLLSLLLGLAVAMAAPAARALEAPPGLLAIQAADRPLTWEAAVAELAAFDVVFLGELHDDAATHRLEAMLLEAMVRASDKPLALSLEMFERDVQGVLDDYLQGRIPEAEFLAKSRPWPNYARDYRPLVEFAKTHGLPVIAANVPRRLASRVAKEGLQALDALPPAERLLAARTVDVPEGRLLERFRASMAAHPGLTEDALMGMFQAQCLKDATMAESIARALEAGSRRVLHVNGAFHSDEGLGVPAQLLARWPRVRLRVTTALPVDDEAGVAAAKASRAAEIVFVLRRDPASPN